MANNINGFDGGNQFITLENGDREQINLNSGFKDRYGRPTPIRCAKCGTRTQQFWSHEGGCGHRKPFCCIPCAAHFETEQKLQ